MDFCGCGLVRARLLKSCGDQDAPELGDHVGGGWLGLGGVPGGVEAAGGDVAGVVARGGVSDDRQGLADQGEGERAADCGGDPVAGLPGTEDLLGVFYRDRSRRMSA